MELVNVVAVVVIIITKEVPQLGIMEMKIFNMATIVRGVK